MSLAPTADFPRAIPCPPSAIPSRNGDAGDAGGSSLPSAETSDYTCSLFSTRMSTNQTADDLPGPGRVIDTYFYQPSGRLLERAINRFVTQINTRWIYREITEAHDAIVAFFDSMLLQSHGEFPVQHRYWQGQQIVTETVPLSTLLYIWGGKKSEAYDDSIVLKQCRTIASFVSSPHPTAQKAALKCITRLLDRFPRLRLYFDLVAMRRKILQADRSQVFDDVYWILSDLQAGQNDIDVLLHNLLTALPIAEITNANFDSCRTSLLVFLMDSLEIFKSHKHDGGILRHEFRHLLEQLLSIEVLLQFQDSCYSENDIVKLFWEKLEESLVNGRAIPKVLTKEMCLSLQRSLKRTWSTLTLSNNVSENTDIEEFVRVSFSIFLQLSMWSRRSVPISSREFEKEKAEIELLVAEKSAISIDDMEVIWKGLHASQP